MTKLDEKALEAAIAALLKAYDTPYTSFNDWGRATIAAYLDALPPAERRYMSRRDDGSLGVMALVYPQSVKNYIEVEIREVRQP